MADTEEGDLTTLTVQLLSAYVANNTVPANELADLIGTTRAALAGRAEATAPEPQAEDYPRPVSIKKSIASPDFIISMVDGKQYKMLKRHLATNGMTPKEYIERYKLPKDYPMVAPTYAEARRKTAERIGLGRKPKEIAQAAPVATQATKEKAVSGKVPPKPTGKAPGSAKSHPKRAAAPSAPKSAPAKTVKKRAATPKVDAPVAAATPESDATTPVRRPRKAKPTVETGTGNVTE